MNDGPGTVNKTFSFHNKVGGSECADHHINWVAAFHRSCRVRKSHPISHARFGRAFLAQLSHLFHVWNGKPDPGLRIVHLRLQFLIVEGYSLAGVRHLIVKPNELARFRRLDAELANTPGSLSTSTGVIRQWDSPLTGKRLDPKA